jgi:small nuclear ribonucleoprotein (snRNP)-like protein
VCPPRLPICLKTQPNLTQKKVTGVLKGYDQLLNLVLDEVEEQVQGNDICTVSHVLPSHLS